MHLNRRLTWCAKVCSGFSALRYLAQYSPSQKSDRANYWTGRHRTVVYERLPSLAGVHFVNRQPNSNKDPPRLKALKARLKRFLVSQAVYNAGEVLAFD
ncbi:hypothetical protein J6590_036538 [Homalodisca vitripennis]|nr:hypothetical protein J6590_036538 [Homalodisca vitripennis]